MSTVLTPFPIAQFLVHPDLDTEEDLLEGFVTTLMQHAKRLQFAAYSGWGRTDLPFKLADTIRNALWYSNIKKHPLETLTLHGFNPLTSYKQEWATIMPSVMSLLQAPNFRTITFLDVPSMRNDDRHPLNWDDIEPLRTIEDASIILAVQELEGELAEQAAGGAGDRGSQGVDSIQQREEAEGEDRHVDENDCEELGERVSHLSSKQAVLIIAEPCSSLSLLPISTAHGRRAAISPSPLPEHPSLDARELSPLWETLVDFVVRYRFRRKRVSTRCEGFHLEVGSRDEVQQVGTNRVQECRGGTLCQVQETSES